MNEILNREFAVSVGAGLTLLGFGLIVMDFFMARLVSRLDYPEYKVTEQELLVGAMPEKEKRRIRTMQSRRDAALTHRMRRGAFVVIAVGCCILLTAWLSGTKGN
jgi:hypothetical protein